MERECFNDLLKWKEQKDRKPLIINGVRQSGKTWLMKEFGRRSYTHTAYFNFDFDEGLKDLFQTTKDPKRLIPQLSLLSGVPIKDSSTLIIFDEIQECPEALNTLKYFYENAPVYMIIAAGSLLGVSLSYHGFPVGKVQFLSVHPMSFTEFLLAADNKNLSEFIHSLNSLEAIPKIFENPLVEKLKQFFITGGMPGIISRYIQDPVSADENLQELIDSYEHDFAKHTDSTMYPKMTLVWRSIPSQLARENKKFLYQTVKEGARAREYEYALQWLVDAGLLHKIYRTKKTGLPLSAYDDVSAFKLYTADIGILRRLSKLAPSVFAQGSRLFTEFNGALSENFVLQSLVHQYDVIPRYWTDEQGKYEVDFIIQHDNIILPVEVKAGMNTQSPSLKKYTQLHGEQTPIRIRFSMQNLMLNDNVLNIPLYLADKAKDLISMALSK